MPDDEEIETIEGNAGEANEQTQLESTIEVILTDEMFDERQRRIGERRKPAGPPLTEGPELESVTDADDVPPTGAEEAENESEV